MRGLKLLQKHGVEYNVMASVARETAQRPLEVYHFFKQQGVEFIQFVPIIERLPGTAEQQLGLIWPVRPRSTGKIQTRWLPTGPYCRRNTAIS